MKYDIQKKEIGLDRKLNQLDKFVLKFCNLLDKNYVIVSGYVSILFGRSRGTEDVDLLIQKLSLTECDLLPAIKDRASFDCSLANNYL